MTVVNGQGLQILNSGSSLIQSPSTFFKLNNILHVPAISSNLLSVNQFTRDHNCLFIFDAAGFTIQDRSSGKTLFHGLSSNGLYPFHGLTTSPGLTGPATFLGEKASSDIWHQRLGHPSFPILQSMVSAFHLPIHGSGIATSFCGSCRLSKSCKLPIGVSDSTTSCPLELIHGDVWGPSPVLSVCSF